MSNVRIISVGNLNEKADKIGEEASILDWTSRVYDLAMPTKAHTMDYMTEYLLRRNSPTHLWKFES